MTIKEIDTLIEEDNSLKQIAQAYSEIANLKLQRIRGELVRNRIFFKEIARVYGMVKNIAYKHALKISKPKKTISLIITSNYRFYGQINSSLIDFFIASTQSLATDRIILGKAAIDYFRSNKVFPNYREVMLKDDQPQASELLNLINLVKDYNQVLVFHSQLKSLLIQQPQALDIVAQTEGIGKEVTENLRFIFEPQLSKILSFFDSQILVLLLEATFLESEVARTASRFISMDQAENEANKYIKENEMLKGYVKRNLVNNQILESFASLSAVRKGTL